MKKIVLAMMALSLAFASIAQKSEDKKEGREFHKHSGKHFDKDKLEKLNLTEEQKVRFKTAKDDFKKQMEELRSNTSLSVEERNSRRQEIVKKHKEAIKSILTPEQQKQAEEFRKERGDKGNFGKGEGREFRGKERFEEMSKDLNLSAEQSAKLKDVNETFRNNIKAVRENSSLTEEQKREQTKSLADAHRSNIKAILTAEQQAKLKSKIGNRSRKHVK